MVNLFSHAGEHHESVVESASHVGQDPLLLWTLLFLAPIVIAFFTHSVFKWKVLNTLLAISVFLIGYSVYTYQDPGLHTVVALGSGFGIVFITSILRLASD